MSDTTETRIVHLGPGIPEVKIEATPVEGTGRVFLVFTYKRVSPGFPALSEMAKLLGVADTAVHRASIPAATWEAIKDDPARLIDKTRKFLVSQGNLAAAEVG